MFAILCWREGDYNSLQIAHIIDDEGNRKGPMFFAKKEDADKQCSVIQPGWKCVVIELVELK